MDEENNRIDSNKLDLKPTFIMGNTELKEKINILLQGYIRSTLIALKDSPLERRAIRSIVVENILSLIKEHEESQWNKAMEILYCEHCGKLMSQDLVDKLKKGTK